MPHKRKISELQLEEAVAKKQKINKAVFLDLLLDTIALFLNGYELCSVVSRVCKSWYRAIYQHDTFLWKKITCFAFGYEPLERDLPIAAHTENRWFEAYRE